MTKKTIYLLIVAVAILGVAVFVSSKLLTPKPDKKTETPLINYRPPTTTEKSSGDAQKEVIVSKQQEPEVQQSTANVVLVDASQYGDVIKVKAYVSNLIQAGECEATFSNGQSTFSRTNPAIEDASTTVCKPFSISRADFPNSGVWSLTVNFKSGDIIGSVSKEIEIR